MKTLLMVLRPGVEYFPPTMNQIHVLHELGFKVHVVDSGPQPLDREKHRIPDSVVHERLISDSRGKPLPERVRSVQRYISGVRKVVRRIRPDYVIAFDAEACWAVGSICRRMAVPFHWHFHELPEPQEEGLAVHIANRWVLSHADLPDAIVFPDQGRANYFIEQSSAKPRLVEIVANCPMLVREVPASQTRSLLSNKLSENAFLFLYHGAIGEDHAFESAIRSMQHWPENARFVLKGHGRPSYIKSLERLAEEAAKSEFLMIPDLGFQSYKDHCAFIAGADVGWTALEPTSNNWKYSATASNKRFECMAFGLPQLSDRNPGVSEILERNHCGICVDIFDPEDIAQAVCRLATSKTLCREMGENARRLHLETYNYESQFASVSDRILHAISGKS